MSRERIIFKTCLMIMIECTVSLKLQGLQGIVIEGILQDLCAVEEMPTYRSHAKQLLPLLYGRVRDGGNCCGGATPLRDVEVLASWTASDYDVSTVCS